MTAKQFNEACERLLKDPDVQESAQDVGRAYITLIVVRLYEKLIEILKEDTDDYSRLSASGQSDSEQAD